MNTVVRPTRSRSALSLLTLACLGSTCLSGAAFAQAQQAQAPAAVDEIVVTGTRVVRDGYEAPTPVSVIGIEQLENQATSNLADSINQLPTLVGSSTPQGSVANTTSGQGAINGLSLRGMGTSRTLVLLNGQRTVGSILTGVVDVSELPQTLIERVDVVTGGASAAYGSDALSGVVNFVLDTDFTGFKSEVSGGITTYGDAPQYKINMTYGTPFAGGRGHLLVSGEHSWEDGLLIGDRPWNREGWSFINNPAYGTGAGQSTSVPNILRVNRTALGPVASWGGTFAVPATHPLYGVSFGPGGTQYKLAIGDIVQGQLMRGGSWESQQIAPVRGVAFQPQQNRQDVFTRVSYDVSDNVQVYAHAAWAHMGSFSTGAPNFFPGNLSLSTDNAFLPAELRPALQPAGVTTTFLFGTMNWDLDSFHAAYDRRVLRFLAGANGDFEMGGQDWKWDMYLGNGESFGSLKSIGAMDRTRYALAVDAVRNPATGAIVCRSTLTNPGNGCVPYNVFGMGVNSQAAVDYLQGRYAWNNHRLNQKVGALSFTGNPFETWAGPVSTAFGYEYRAESMRQISDPEEQANPTMWFQAAGQPYTGGVKVHDLFLETVVPLAKDTEWASALDLNGAVRGTHYSTYGWVGTWKVGATYSPFDDLRFRITQSRNIRSPTLVDLYQAGSTARSSTTDPFNNNRAVNSQTTTRGNPNLGPEKSSDTGVGVVYQPGWFPGFSASVDYYRIKINGAVNQLGSQDLLNLCFLGNQVACSTFTRVDVGTPAEQINFTVQPQNFASERAKGIDFEASYSLPLSSVSDSMDGNLALRMLATHYISYTTFSGIPNDIVIELAGAPGSSGSNIGGGGGGLPDWRINSSINYALDPVAVGFTFRYIAGGLNQPTWIECTTGCPVSTGLRTTVDNNRVASAFFVDFNSSYTLHLSDTAETELFFNVRNLTNADPPIAVRGPGGSSWDFPPTNQGLYDIMGRIFRAGLKFKM
ncbi:MAG: TonB-dependent receptor [Rhodospirillaceae bacterium]|nr:TonB-dependent receptor [Rhodospirillaceae bacterium]